MEPSLPREALIIPTEMQGLVLRELSTPEDDIAYFAAVEANRDHLSQFGDVTAAHYKTIEDVTASRLNAGDKKRMGIWHDGTFVGTVNMRPQKDGTSAEIGYWLDSRHEGHGYATVATRALSGYAAQRYSRVFAEVIRGNEKSAKVLRRAGFTQTASFVGDMVFELLQSAETQPIQAIRSAQKGDAEKLKPVLDSWIKNAETGDVIDDEVTEVMNAIEASVNGANARHYVVATDDSGKAIGVMGLKIPEAKMKAQASTLNPVEIINAFVDPTLRGTGIGKKLVQQLEELALQLGHTEIILNSGPRYKNSGWAFWTSVFGKSASRLEDEYGTGLHAPVWKKVLS